MYTLHKIVNKNINIEIERERNRKQKFHRIVQPRGITKDVMRGTKKKTFSLSSCANFLLISQCVPN